MLGRCTSSASMLYTTYVANHFMLNQKQEKKTNRPLEQQLSPKTEEFLAKLQRIHDNVLRDIKDL